MRNFSLALATCWKSLYLKEAAAGMFSPSRDNDLWQFVKEDEIQSDILPDVFVFSSERDIKNCYKSPLLNDPVLISYIAMQLLQMSNAQLLLHCLHCLLISSLHV